MRPSVGGMNPVIMRMDVDFPAPLGPRNPSTSPRSTENETPLTARFVPNVLTKFSTLIMALLNLLTFFCRWKRREQITTRPAPVKRLRGISHGAFGYALLLADATFDEGNWKMFKKNSTQSRRNESGNRFLKTITWSANLFSVRQRKLRRQSPHALADGVSSFHVFDVHQHFADHVCDGRHLWLHHAACRD